MKTSARNAKRISESLRRMLWILLLSIGLAGFALPGLSKSSGPRTNSPTDGGAAKPASVSPKHRNAPVHPIASQPDRTPAKRSDGSNGSPAGNSGAAASPQATARGPKIWLQGTRKLQATFTGTSKNRTASSANLSDAANLAQNNAAAMVLGAGQGQPLSIAKGDLDQDGIEDLVVGYATPAGPALTVYRGNLDAFAPQSDASFQAIGRGEFPSPFLPEAHVVTVPVNPDFIVTGNFIPGGFQDIVIAGRGGNALYLLPGDGKGNFGAPQILSIPGTVTSLAAGEFGDSSLGIKLFVGTSDPKNGFGLSVFNFSDGALSTLGSYHLNGAASNVEFGDFGDSGTDVAFLSGGQINIVRPSLQLEQVSLPVSASAFALGSFIYDRNGGSQIAVLGSDGSINIAARTEFNPRLFTAQEFQAIRHAGLHHQASPLLPARSFPVNGWKIVESFPSVATADSSQAPLFFRTRVSNNGSDDVMWLNSSSEQMAVISHPSSQPGAATFVPGNVSVVPYSGTPLHAMPMRINVDGRPGIVALHQGDPAPYMVMPIPDPTFTVNRFDDPVPVSPITNACNGVANDCSLREAVLKANGDTIMLPAGTYNLTIGRPAAPDYTGNHGALYVNNSATIVGAGQNSTIIQWGIPSSGTVDMIMAVNEDISPLSNASASISNLTIRGGFNHGSDNGPAATEDGDGGAMEYDTGTSGNATLALTNVTIENSQTTDGGGGGIVLFNFLTPGGTGNATFTNCVIQNNSVAGTGGALQSGGGIAISFGVKVTITSSQILNNQATQTLSGNGSAAGGILYFGTPAGGQQPAIHGSVISGNTASGDGGGIYMVGAMTIDQGTIISNNNGGTAHAVNAAEGGGIWMNISPATANFSKITVTGNTAGGNGGGIHVDDSGGAVNISFSRITGNTAGGVGNDLHNRSDINVDPGTTVTAKNNWWGTNTPGSNLSPSTSTCPATSRTICFDPFIVLRHTATPSTVIINTTTTLTASFLQDNHATAIAASNLDVLTGVAPSVPLAITFGNAVRGTISAVNGTGSNSAGTIQAAGTATATFTATSGGAGSADATVDQQTVTAPITIPLPPVIIKAFGAASIPLNGATSLTFTIQNNNATQSLSGVGFSDTLPAGLVVSTPNGLTGSCGGGTITATQATGIISLTNAALATTSSCTFAVNVTGTTAGTKNNTTGAVTSTEGGTGGTASASVNVVTPPAIAKAFGAANIPLNGTTSLTLTLTNPAANAIAETGVAFTDTFPAGLVVATPNGLTNTCGGVATAVAGSGSVSLTGGTIAASGTCTLTVNITGTASGNFVNTTGTVSSTNGGTGNTATANLGVATPPTITKSFGASSIPLNGSTSLTFTISNPAANTISLTGIAFTDTLPAGLVVATPNALTSTCGGTATAVAGSGVLTLTGSTLAPNTSCAVSANVTGTVAGVKNNSVQITSTEGGTGNTSNASITVISAPVLTKQFGVIPVASIALNGTIDLDFSIANNNATQSFTGIGFTDTLPAGLIISTPNALAGSCGAGTITATAGTNVISLSGGTLPAASNCNFHLNVTGTTAGAKNNTTGNVTSTEGGTGGTASASIAVVAPPSIAKAFGAANLPLNGSTSLTFTITNPAANTVAEAGVAFTDTLPAGLVVATPNGLTNTCGGTGTAVAGSGSASLTGGTIAVNSTCTLTVNVTGTASGNFVNTTGTVTSTNGGTGNTATANLTVATPPTIVKAFGASSIPLNGSTSLTFTIANPAANTISLTGIAFTDNLPSGLVVATPNGLANTCGGVATAVAGSGVVSLAGNTLAPNTSCTVSANVTGTTAGVKNNSVQVTSTEGGVGNTSNASITVTAPPVIIKAFGAASVPLNGSTSLTFTIQNNNTGTTLTGVGFSDTLPAGTVISTPNGLTGSCGGGTITSVQNTNVISLTGATLASSTSCTFAVNVTGTAAGTKNNTTGNVTSVEGGTGGTASASINVVSPPSIAKAFGAANLPLNGTTSLTFTISNPAGNAIAETGVAFTDTLPAGLVVATPNGLTNTCGGTATAVAGSSGISLTGGTIAATSTCTLTANITGVASGQFVNTTGNVTSTNGGTGNTATANLSVATPPVIVKAFGATSISLNASTSLTFTINNPATNTISLTGIAFTDNLPAGLVVATPSALTTTCTGAAAATAGSGVVTLLGSTLAPNTSCTVSANVTGTTGGAKNNSVQVTATESGPGNTSNASITIVAPPVIIKAFGAASVPLNGSTSLTFTIQNNNAGSALTGVAFTDAFPAGLLISTPNGIAGSCGGGVITAVQATGAVSLTAATLAPNTSCTFAINTTGATAGAKNNTTGNVASVEGGTGGTASASLAVVAAPSIAKAFSPTTIPVNTNSMLTLTITNPAANSVALTGVAFTDTFPAGVVISTPNALTNTCGGVVTTTAGSGTASLTGGTVAASSSCTITLNVTSATRGVFNNTTGAVSSTNGGAGNTASATLTVIAPDLTISKSHSGNFLLGQVGATYSLTVNNIGTDATLGTVTVVDTLPAGLTATAISGTGWTCTLATLTCTRADALAAGSSYPAITLTVNVSAGAVSPATNNVAVSGGGEVNLANDTAADVTTISTFTFTTTTATMTIRAGQTATYNLAITPVGGAVTIPITIAGITTAPKTTVAPSASPVTPGASPVAITFTAITTPGLGFLSQQTGSKTAPVVALLFPMGLIVLTGLGAGKFKKNKKFTGWIALILVISFFGMGVMGCVGNQANFENLGTPPGTYTITVGALAGGTQQSVVLTLIVQP